MQPLYWTNHPIKMSLTSSPAVDAKERTKLWLYTNPVPLCLLVGQAGVDSLEAPSLLILNS